jgi:hypothetical protein
MVGKSSKARPLVAAIQGILRKGQLKITCIMQLKVKGGICNTWPVFHNKPAPITWNVKPLATKRQIPTQTLWS